MMQSDDTDTASFIATCLFLGISAPLTYWTRNSKFWSITGVAPVAATVLDVSTISFNGNPFMDLKTCLSISKP